MIFTRYGERLLGKVATLKSKYFLQLDECIDNNPLNEQGTIDVYILRFDTQFAANEIASFESLLEEKEQKRYHKMKHAAKRSEYLVAQATLRYLLARYTQTNPADIAYERSKHGKPYLLGNSGWPDIRFNITHSRGMVLIALTLDNEIGIDIEGLDHHVTIDRIASRVLSPVELAQLSEIPEDQKEFVFLRHWTRKEASVKCSGRGIFSQINMLTISMNNNPAIIEASGQHDIAINYQLRGLELPETHVGTLALDGEICTIRYHNLVPSNKYQSKQVSY